MQAELERIRAKSEFVQQAESLVLDEILEQSAMPYPDSTPIPNKYKRWSAEKKEAAFFSSQYNNKQKSTVTADANSSKEEGLTVGMIPDVLTTFRQKIESMTLFDSDLFKQIGKDITDSQDEEMRKSKENLRRAFQQSILASILVSLSHKRYERRRNAAMDIEKAFVCAA